MKAKLKNIVLDTTITGDNVGELFKKVKGKDYMGFTDYAGRKITMSKKVFDKHTEGKYLKPEESRHQLFPHIKDVLKAPDEVWYNEYRKGKYQSKYLKFYKDKVIVVDCSVDSKQGLKINTWYEMKLDEKEIRKGLKIK